MAAVYLEIWGASKVASVHKCICWLFCLCPLRIRERRDVEGSEERGVQIKETLLKLIVIII